MKQTPTKSKPEDGLQVPQRLSNHLIGIAGVHHVVSELWRRGLVALPTVRNIAAYDVLVATVDGTRHANIQVKASQKRVNFFPMPPAEKVLAGRHDWYVLVRWLPKENRFEGFMLSGREARAEVAHSAKLQARRIKSGGRKKLFPALPVGPGAEPRASTWRTRWERWKL